MTDSAFSAPVAAVDEALAIDHVPSSASVPVGTASQPPRPLTQAPLAEETNAEEETAYLVARRLAAQLHASVEAFTGKELAVYSWTAGHGSTGSCHATLVRAKAGKGNLTRLVVRLSSERGSHEFTVPVNVYGQKTGAVRVRITAVGRIRDWLLVDAENAEQWLNGELVPDACYPNPTNTPGLEHVGRLWYSTEDTRSQNIPINKRRPTEVPGIGALQKAWASFEGGDSLKQRWLVHLFPLTEELACEAWGAHVLAFALWGILVSLHQDAGTEDNVTAESVGLPPTDAYFPRRPVDLRTSDVLEALSSKTDESPISLKLPWHVVEAACAALNARKNVIFTGPPGCGKTKLAVALARIATKVSPLVATASPAWSSGDLMGRYVPNRQGRGLDFHPGHFLRAVEQDRWLVIDEFNRANTDECFGELFSVLAGDTVELPFRAPIEDSEAGAEGQDSPDGIVRIVPAAHEGSTRRELSSGYRDYQVGPAFRVIGTMNDADRATLHQLSFALQRRFDIIRVEAPPPTVVKEIIADGINEFFDENEMYRFRSHGGQNALRPRPKALLRIFSALFAKEVRPGRARATNGGERRVRPFGDLVSERIVGIATVLDVLRLVSEGLRCPLRADQGENIVQLSEGVDDWEVVAASYLAMGLALSVFPQFEALQTDEELARATKHTVDAFRHSSGASIPFVRIQPNDEEGAASSFVASVEAAGGQMLDRDEDGRITIPEYLVGELKRQFAGTGREELLDRAIQREPHPSEP